MCSRAVRAIYLSLCICIVITGSLIVAKTGAIMETEGWEDRENLGEGACSSDELLERFKLCISLFCHALRSQVSLPLCEMILCSQALYYLHHMVLFLTGHPSSRALCINGVLYT